MAARHLLRHMSRDRGLSLGGEGARPSAAMHLHAIETKLCLQEQRALQLGERHREQRRVHVSERGRVGECPQQLLAVLLEHGLDLGLLRAALAARDGVLHAIVDALPSEHEAAVAGDRDLGDANVAADRATVLNGVDALYAADVPLVEQLAHDACAAELSPARPPSHSSLRRNSRDLRTPRGQQRSYTTVVIYNQPWLRPCYTFPSS